MKVINKITIITMMKYHDNSITNYSNNNKENIITVQ